MKQSSSLAFARRLLLDVAAVLVRARFNALRIVLRTFLVALAFVFTPIFPNAKIGVFWFFALEGAPKTP